MPPDPSQPKVVVVMPAYNAARTLVRTYRDIPPGVVDHVILVDDLSRDDTVAVAELLNLQVVVHRQNLGYGGNQKTCYDTALAEGADVVVMLHPDYQYDATRIPDLVAPILAGEADMVLGSRFLGDPLAGGMPRWKYVANRFLTTSRTGPTTCACPSTTPASGPTPASSWRRSTTTPTPTTSSSTRSWSARSSGPASASPRSPSPPATSPRPARSTSAARWCTACRPCAPWPATAAPSAELVGSG